MPTENQHSAGELLRQGRLKQRLSIAECAKRTHIAQHYIGSLEDDKWEDLPSESHRLGFLRLYARFLGVPVEEVLALYRQKAASSAAQSPTQSGSSEMHRQETKEERRLFDRWSPLSIPQLVGFGIVGLLAAWSLYHVLSPRLFEQNVMPWARRNASRQPRLVTPKSTLSFQKVRMKAMADSWLRVTSRNQLLFEGILTAGAAKEWSGSGPFQFKIGNVRALSLFWNDQPVDIQAGAHGSINEIRIPPQ